MRILLTGASGFIGRHLLRALLADGHQVTGCSRQPGGWRTRFPQVRWLSCDFARDHDADLWLARLQDIDVVINAAGIFQERGGQSFDDIHTRTPIALFRAASRTGVRRVIQISALGADARAQSEFHRSKRAADEVLLALPLDAVILYPSIVLGSGGGSTRLFSALAALPLLPVPDRGEQRLQPLALDDLCACVLALLRLQRTETERKLALVGAEQITFAGLLQALRQWLALKPAPVVPIPLPLVRVLAQLNDKLRLGLLDSAALNMLLRGNCADPAPLAALLGRPPYAVDTALQRIDDAPAARREARLFLLRPLLRLSIAFLWIFTGIVSAFLYPRAASYELLAAAGIGGMLAPLALYGAAALDVALGVATLLAYRLRWVVGAQVVVMLAYTAIISFALPQLWLHPFGPVSKNLPLLAATLIMLVLEER